MPNFCLSHKRVKVLARMADRRFHAGKTAAPDLRQTRPDPAQGPPEFAELKHSDSAPVARERKRSGSESRGTGLTGAFGDEVVHGIFVRRGWCCSLAGAQAQALVSLTGHGGADLRRRPTWRRPMPRRRVTAMARAALRLRPGLLPLTEVYAVLRENGFSPLGIPRLRGFVYTIAVIDRGGEDGRLVIDARNGRIIRFMPAYGMGGNFYEERRSHLTGRKARCRRRPWSAVARRAAAVRSHMSQAAPCRCRRPARSRAEAAPPPNRPSRRSSRPRRQTAAVQAKPPRPRRKPRRPRPSARPSPRAHDPADAGDAGSAGAGLDAEPDRIAPRRPGRFCAGRCSASAAQLFRCPRRPGSGWRPPSDATPATGGRRRVRPWWRSCAWRETARGRD